MRCHPANRSFLEHLERLRADCGSKGYYAQERTYSRALRAVRRYPLPLRSAHEVADLDGMGKACCRIFEEHRDRPVEEQEEAAWRDICKKRLQKALAKPKTSSFARRSTAKPVAKPSKVKGKGKGKGKWKGKGKGKGRGRGRARPEPSDDEPLSQLVALPDASESNEMNALVPCEVTPSLERSPLTGGCELLSQPLEHFAFLGDQGSGLPSSQPCADALSPPRKLRRSTSEPVPKVVRPRQLVATRSEPPVPRRARQSAALQSFVAPGRLVLLLDHREVGAGKEHTLRRAMLSELQKRLGSEAVEARALPLGDALWIWRSEEEELVTGWIVERKTFPDLSSSIMDGRYEEQKGRLLEAPNLQGVIFLVEGSGSLFGAADGGGNARGFGQRLAAPRLCERALATSAAHTQLISGFHVLHSASTPHTVALLSALHNGLAKQRHGGSQGAWVSYEDFAEKTRKHGQRRVFEAFGRMLRVVPSCGAEATEVLVDEFQTPQALAQALRDSSDSELLQRLRKRGRITQTALSALRQLYT